MQAEQQDILDVFRRPHSQYVIPVFQRSYAWAEKQCADLWLDLKHAALNNRRHFLGTILYLSEPHNTQSPLQQLSVIDGQQRLTTLTLLLTAFARYLKAHPNITINKTSAHDIQCHFLHCGSEHSEEPRLVLSRSDHTTLVALINDAELPDKPSECVMRNFAFFLDKMKHETFDAELFWKSIVDAFIIFVELKRTDQPQHVFESLNSKGVPLTTADLIRNFLLLCENPNEQVRLYDEYWKPMCGLFEPDPGSLKLDNAIHGWLQVRYPKVRALNSSEVYNIFKLYVESEHEGTKEDLLAELRNFSLMWAENYKYHAVKKYKSSFDWAKNGKQKTLVSDYPLKPKTIEAIPAKTLPTKHKIDYRPEG